MFARPWATIPFILPPTMAGVQAVSTALAYLVRFSLTAGSRKNSPARGLLRSGGRRWSEGTRCCGNIDT
eukprot:3800993-Prymnesium_polylepis.1